MPFAFFEGHTSKILITFHLLQLCPLHAIIISGKNFPRVSCSFFIKEGLLVNR